MRRRWTEEENEILRRMYADPTVVARDIAEILGRSVPAVNNHAKVIGVRKPDEYLYWCGKRLSESDGARKTRFRKGSIPPNKGKKMPPETYRKVAPTMFRKGHVPANHRPVGSERVNADGYVEMKVAEPNRWRPKHRVVWEEANGPVPAGCNIQFRNGDRLDVRLDNLYMITRADQLRDENSLCARYPKNVQEVIRLRGAVKRQMTIYLKKQKNG